MTPSKFKRLKIGDAVTLAESLPEYSCGHKTPDGRVYVPAGAIGIIGSINVPSVCRNNVVFHCVDFTHDTKLQDCKGRPVVSWDKHNRYRVAAKPGDLV